jgi:plastocyanin
LRARYVLSLLVCGLAACVRPLPPAFTSPTLPAVYTASLTGSLIGTGEVKADFSRAIVFLEPIPETHAPATLGDAEVRVQRGRFDPSVQIVQRGQRVTWTNLDPVFHGVFSYSRRNEFDLGVFAPSEQRSAAFAEAGPVRFHCPIHIGEGGVVFVAPSPYFTRSSRRASFELRGVPPGRYWLSAWTDGWSAAPREITLRAGESAHAGVLLRPERE